MGEFKQIKISHFMFIECKTGENIWDAEVDDRNAQVFVACLYVVPKGH